MESVRIPDGVKQGRQTITHRLVFLTLLTMVSKSIGLIDLKLMTSTVTPSSFSRISAAKTQCPTDLEWATSVMSFPSRSILALPMGRTNSSDVAHSFETGKDCPYRISFSRTTTGFGSRMAACERQKRREEVTCQQVNLTRSGSSVGK